MTLVSVKGRRFSIFKVVLPVDRLATLAETKPEPTARLINLASEAPSSAETAVASLNETTPPSSRPSNSGMATCVAASSGVSPVSEVSHASRELVAHTACSTGTSSAARAVASQSSASAAPDPPVASIVVSSAST